MTRSALALAALASAAVPGLDPATVEAVETRPGQQFELAFVQDTQHRRWVVRAPLTRAAGAQMDVTVALLGLLSRRLPFSVPTPKGFVALKEGGRAAVYPFLPGRPLELTHLPAGPGLAAEIGRSIAALHNVDRQLYDEAGLPSYDADTYRTRRLSELDRAAATGHVPTRLLARWEAALEDVSLWRFAPTPTHGDLGGEEILAVFEDEHDASSGRVRAFTGWEDAKVADPADDFATLVSQASTEAVDSVMEAYAHARVDRPDPHLESRARLAGELRLVTALLAATAAGDQAAVDSCSARLRRLDDYTASQPLTAPKVVLSTTPVVPGVSMPPVVIEERVAPAGAGSEQPAPSSDEAMQRDAGSADHAEADSALADAAGGDADDADEVHPAAQAGDGRPDDAGVTTTPAGHGDDAGQAAAGSGGATAMDRVSPDEVHPGHPAGVTPAPQQTGTGNRHGEHEPHDEGTVHGEHDEDMTQPIPLQQSSQEHRDSSTATGAPSLVQPPRRSGRSVRQRREQPHQLGLVRHRRPHRLTAGGVVERSVDLVQLAARATGRRPAGRPPAAAPPPVPGPPTAWPRSSSRPR